MKYLITLLALALFSFLIPSADRQKTATPMEFDDYEKSWKKIDSLESNGLTKSAYDQVEKLYLKAVAESNDEQRIKTLIYSAKYLQVLEEESELKSLIRFETELNQLEFPAKQILASYLAELYQNYYSARSYIIDDRTALADTYALNDLMEWPRDAFIKKMNALHHEATENSDLENIALGDFNALIINLEEEGARIRDNMYDVLVHRAIAFYQNSMYLTNDLPDMDWDNPLLYAPAQIFVDAELAGTHDESPSLVVLQMLQKLTKFHLNTSDDKLLDIDLKRIDYVHNRSSADEKDTWYLKYLNNLMVKYQGTEHMVLISKKLSGYYVRKASAYTGDGSEAKSYYIKAKVLLDEALKSYPSSRYSKDCQSLLNQVLQKEIHIELEQVSSINESLLGSLQFRNLEQVYFQVYKVDPKKIVNRSGKDFDEMIQYVKSSELVKSWDIEIPETDDFHRHRLEFMIEALNGGSYALLASANADFSNSNNALGYASFHISNLAYTKYDDKKHSSLLVFDRNTGSPVSNANINIYTNSYNNRRGEQEINLAFSLISDKDGKVDFTLDGVRDYFNVEIKTQKDYLNLNEYHRFTNINNGHQRSKVHLMTDRSIYRPGQIAHLKGIVIKYNAKGIPSIQPHASGIIEFRNANGKVVQETKVKANEYGSFSSNIILPSDGLAGRMSIISKFENARSQASIRVEEYKRPKFKVEIDTLKQTYVLNDSVAITGKAMSYNGFGIGEGDVKFTVTRSIYSPWRYNWRQRWPVSNSNKIIASGFAKTSADGSFKIDFVAKGLLKTQGQYIPGYQFMIHVDVTDQSGETRSGSYPVRISETPFFIHSDLTRSIDAEKLKGIRVTCENLNGAEVSVKGIIHIEKLIEEKNALKTRKWKEPDVFLYQRALFKDVFKDRVYQDEDNPENWEVDKKIMDLKFDTEHLNPAPLEKALGSGTYKINIEATDAFGNTRNEIQYLSVHQTSTCDFAFGTILDIQKDKQSYQPGAKVKINFTSAQKPLKLYYILEKDKRIEDQQWLVIRDKKSIEIPVSEKDRGGFAVHLMYSVNGALVTQKLNIDVPWTNKVLDLEFEVFRDELLPGQEEEWRIKVKDSNGDRVKAELLASMYDASLDAFVGHAWGDNFYPNYHAYLRLESKGYGISNARFRHNDWNPKYVGMSSALIYPLLDKFGLSFYNRYDNSGVLWADAEAMDDGVMMEKSAPANMKSRNVDGIRATSAGVSSDADQVESNIDEQTGAEEFELPVRENLDETVFFYPELSTNEAGDVIFTFKMKEALTQWNFMTFAHTKDFEVAYKTAKVVTKKDLMVFPNLPRFFRHGDLIFLGGKIQNTLDTEINAEVELSFLDPITLNGLDAFNKDLVKKQVVIPANSAVAVRWEINIPEQQLLPMAVRMIAKSGQFSDGEQQLIPVVSNRTMVTESYALPLKAEEHRTFSLNAFDDAKASESAVFHKYALEFTSNPAWYAVQALPYIMEYPHQCTEQIFNRYYANTLASYVANSNPKIKAVFTQWQNSDALISALSKNEDLKSAILEETPWVRDAVSETEQKKRIGLLFDLNKMSKEQDQAMRKINLRQLADGGFPWFDGPKSNRYITQYILEGIGHLDKLGVSRSDLDDQMLKKALGYVDAALLKEYNYLVKHKIDLNQNHLTSIAIHYLYVRSFFNEQISSKTKVAFDYYMSQADKFWLDKGLYEQAMIALAKSRYNEGDLTTKIVRSLKERSIIHDELGMYWKTTAGYYWFEAPIERHALMVELFEDQQDFVTVSLLKTWLLKNKQTNAWKTTKATASAVYALLMGGENWLMSSEVATIQLGDEAIEFNQSTPEAGTGYVKKTWKGSDIKNSFNTVTISNPNKHIAWGGVYYQYFEDLDKIKTFEETPLTLKKSVYKKMVDGSQHILVPIGQTELKVGDELIVKIDLKVDRDMEFIHLKDMRGSGLEPLNVLSGYKWSHGLGYYESTKDLATHFFMDYLPKGSYVFEYPLRVFHAGNFSNGITTIQSMYAPEFSAHSEGIKIEVKE